MTCKDLIEFLDRYVSGELSSETRKRFDEHLAQCPECVDYLDSYRKTIRLGREALVGDGEDEVGEMPDDLVEAILASVR